MPNIIIPQCQVLLGSTTRFSVEVLIILHEIDQLPAVLDVQFFINIIDVCLHRGVRDKELIFDLPVAFPLEDETDNLPFSLGETIFIEKC